MIKKNILLLAVLHFSLFSLIAEPFRVGIAGSMMKVKHDHTAINQVTFKDYVFIDMAKDESESFQLVIFPEGNDVRNLNVEFSGFIPNEQTIAFHYNKVGYVKTANPTYDVENVGWWPDPLLPEKSLTVSKFEVQPLWCRFNTTPTTPSGVYKGTIKVSSGKENRIITIVVKVRKFTIPRPGTFEAPFGLYKFAIEDWYFGKRGTMSVEEFKKWAEMLGEYRLTPKNIGTEFINKTFELVNGNKELATVDMSALNPMLPELTKKYYPDYTYELYRLPSAPGLEEKLKKGSLMTPEELTAPFEKHLKEWEKQEFTDKTYIYGIDEPQSEEILNYCGEIYSSLKAEHPFIKIMQTGNCVLPDLIGLVDIWCPLSSNAWDPFFQERVKDGDKLWQYVCISPNPPYANFFVDEPGVDHRNLFWQTRKIGASGMLYWTVFWVNKLKNKACDGKHSFPDIPFDFTNSEFYTDSWNHANGDGMMLYPGKDLKPLPSIRLEIIRDGIEDYEYFVVLDKLIKLVEQIPAYKNNRNLLDIARKLTKVPDTIVQSATIYTKDPELILNQRKQIADMIEQLMDIVENKDYERWLKK